MSQYIVYCRKSSESEERQVLSIESQIKELDTLKERLKLDVAETLTESKSAKSPGRPIFNSMMKKVYQGKIKGIITWKLDRLARNPLDGSALVWALDQGKISEIVTPHGTFLNNSNDKFLMQIEFGMAKKYVDDLSDNVKRGNRAKLERGWIPGYAPPGYLNEPVERTIVKDPERFLLIRKIWDLVLQGIPVSTIHRMTEEWGLRTRKRVGGNFISLAEIYRILGNSFYFGLIERKEGVFPGKHEPLINEDEYWKVQEILGRKGRPRPKTHQFAYTGLIRCGECGSMITAEEKDNRYGSHYIYYRCTKKKKNLRCHQRYINLNKLENQILEYLSKIHIPERFLNLALEYLKEEEREEREKFFDIQRSLERSLKDCQKRLDNLNRMRLNDLIDDQEYIGEKKRLLGEKMKLEKNLNDPDGSRKRSLTLTEKTFVFASQAKETFKNGTMEDKRSILQEIGSNFSLKDRKLFIQAEKPILIIEEGLKRIQTGIGGLEPWDNGLIKAENGLPLSLNQHWSALVDDVRTFFRQQIERPPQMP